MDDDDDPDGYEDQCKHGEPHGGEDCCECEDEAADEREQRESVENLIYKLKHGCWPVEGTDVQTSLTADDSGSYPCMLQPCEHGNFAETCTWCEAGIPPWDGDY